MPAPAAAAAAAGIPWGAIIAALGSLGGSWLMSRGAGNAADRQLTASREAQTSA